MNPSLTIVAGISILLASLANGSDPTKEQISLISHWLSHTSEAAIHQMRGASGNKVYLHKEGHREAVYDAAGELVKDGVNDGSYNYAHPIKEPLKHFNRDILPWIMWGGSRTDPTSVEERLNAYSRSLGIGLGTAQATPKAAPEKALDTTKVEEAELEVVEFFLRVIDEGGVQEVFEILKDPDYEPRAPLEIGKGLTRGLIAAVDSGDFSPVNPN